MSWPTCPLIKSHLLFHVQAWAWKTYKSLLILEVELKRRLVGILRTWWVALVLWPMFVSHHSFVFFLSSEDGGIFCSWLRIYWWNGSYNLPSYVTRSHGCSSYNVDQIPLGVQKSLKCNIYKVHPHCQFHTFNFCEGCFVFGQFVISIRSSSWACHLVCKFLCTLASRGSGFGQWQLAWWGMALAARILILNVIPIKCSPAHQGWWQQT